MNQVGIRLLSFTLCNKTYIATFQQCYDAKNMLNSSGNCMYCNVFFHHLAAHMLSLETCMLASQESLSNKRVHQENMAKNVYIDLNTLTRNEPKRQYKR